MPEIARHEIPLTDDAAIKAIVASFEIKSLLALREENEKRAPKPEAAPDADPDQLMLPLDLPVTPHRPQIARAPWETDEAPPLWRSYFYHGSTYRRWHENADEWLAVDEDAGVVRRVVITGLKNEAEAKAVRREYALRSASGENIEQVAARVASDPERERRDYQRQFRYHLSYSHRFFAWSEGEVIETSGHILPISESGLSAEDIELIRQVFARLPYTDRKLPLGAETKRSEPIKNLKKAREKVKQHVREFADAGFAAWVGQCLDTKTDKWSRSRDPLYFHYKAWIRKGGHGQNMGERAEAKATVLSEVKWGMLMRRRFPDDWRQDKRSILYRVTVKRGA